MRPAPSREPLHRRIFREMADALTATLEDQKLSWPAVDAAEDRMRARVHLKMARLLGAVDTDPGMPQILATLADDAPAQAAHDAALVRRWRQAQGIVVDASGARERVMQRLEVMAARMRFYAEPQG
jgi:hypothetical protein